MFNTRDVVKNSCKRLTKSNQRETPSNCHTHKKGDNEKNSWWQLMADVWGFWESNYIYTFLSATGHTSQLKEIGKNERDSRIIFISRGRFRATLATTIQSQVRFPRVLFFVAFVEWDTGWNEARVFNYNYRSPFFPPLSSRIVEFCALAELFWGSQNLRNFLLGLRKPTDSFETLSFSQCTHV